MKLNIDTQTSLFPSAAIAPMQCYKPFSGRVLNLYAGLGGNRKKWQGVAVTAVEMEEDIANVYKQNFPNDTVIIGDAHQYLLDHCHDSLKVRGLLCNRCNTTLGLVNDDVSTLKKMIDYLK